MLLPLRKVIDLKKPFPRILLMLIGVIGGLVIACAVFIATGHSFFVKTPEKPPSSANVNNADLTALAYSVLEHIRDGDFVALSQVAHPDYGVVFSPYTTVTLSTNRRFSAEQIALFDTDHSIYVWGIYNGTGEPIELTPASYFAEFVLPRDYYTEASVIGINRVVGSGNALENVLDEFPGLRFVDFHIPGGEKDTAEELDWSSLRIGFEEHEGSLWLTVILRSTWAV